MRRTGFLLQGDSFGQSIYSVFKNVPEDRRKGSVFQLTKEAL